MFRFSIKNRNFFSFYIAWNDFCVLKISIKCICTFFNKVNLMWFLSDVDWGTGGIGLWDGFLGD